MVTSTAEALEASYGTPLLLGFLLAFAQPRRVRVRSIDVHNRVAAAVRPKVDTAAGLDITAQFG